MAIISKPLMAEEIKIVAIDSPDQEVLRKKTVDISEEDWPLAQEISSRLYEGLKPYFPAAGLAAPQIGINRSVFIYSFDRDPKNLETVINPHLEPVGEERAEGWEGCLSVMTSQGESKLARIPRYAVIRVRYTNLKAERVEKVLDGFAAKVFQHEFDHLQGIVNINHPEAEVKSFESKEALQAFMVEVKKADAQRYNKPNE